MSGDQVAMGLLMVVVGAFALLGLWAVLTSKPK